MEKGPFASQRQYRQSHYSRSSFDKKQHMYFLKRLCGKDIYNLRIYQIEKITSFQLYYQERFDDDNLDWKNKLLMHLVTEDRKLCAFQFKLLNDVLYINKMPLKFGEVGLPLFLSFTKLHTTYFTTAVS